MKTTSRLIVCALVLLAAMLFLAGCVSTPTPAASKILEADEEMVKGCQFLGTMTGKSSLGRALPETGEANAKNDLLKQAASKGATHVIWRDITFNGWGWRQTGRVYKCQ